METFIGQIAMFGFDFPPRDWMLCRGQSLAVSQYSALFALLGTNFGGDGSAVFNLPNLQGRSPLCMNSSYPIGATTPGTVTLTTPNLPAHNHTATMTMSSLSATTTLKATTDTGGVGAPVAGAGLCAATAGTGTAAIYKTPTPTTNLVALGNISTTVTGDGTVTVNNTGNGQAFNVMGPTLAVNFCIAVNGIFPTRN